MKLHGNGNKPTIACLLAAIASFVCSTVTCFSVVPPPSAALVEFLSSPSSQAKNTLPRPPPLLDTTPSPPLPLQPTPLQPTPWAKAVLDYSAANSYMEHYYGITEYFAKAKQGQAEQVYNARHGVLVHDGSTAKLVAEPTLQACGFALVDAPSPQEQVDDWKDSLDQVRRVYLPRARHALLQAYASTNLVARCSTH